MQLLLTGGTGFFGKALLRHWVAADQRGESMPSVTVVTRSPAAFAARYPDLVNCPWIELLEGNVLVPDSLPRGRRFSHVLHAATESTLGPQLTPLERYDQIVNGTRNLLDLAVICEAKRFLLTSSGGVYGPIPLGYERMPEDHLGIADPLNPGNAYCAAKRSSEHLCALYRQANGLETVIARCFAFVGQDLPLDVHFAIGNFIRDALQRHEVVVGGDGSPIRSYMDQRDLARWLLVLLEHGAAGEAFNVGSDEGLSLGAIAHRVRDLLAPKKEVKILGTQDNASFRSVYVPSIEKAKTVVGLRLEYTLDQAILETAKWVS